MELKDLPVDIRVDVEERAAIMEFDGGLTREEAEKQALAIHEEQR
jgi:hypothetical protein